MEQVLTTASGFILMIMLGHYLKKKGVIRLEDKDFLGKILLNVCLPGVIITSFRTFTFEISYLVALGMGSLCNLGGIFLGYLLCRKGVKEERALLMMLSSGYNIGIFTIPFVSTFFSDTAVLAVLMFDVGNAAFVLGGTSAIVSGLLEKKKGNPLPSIFEKMSKSVTIRTYLVMFLLVGLGIEIPEAVFQMADIPANATAFLAMIMVGVMLEFKIDLSEKAELIRVLASRYCFGITMAGLMFWCLPFDIEVRKALMIGVISPMSTASMVYAQQFGCKPSLVGGASTFSILISMALIVGISLVF